MEKVLDLLKQCMDKGASLTIKKDAIGLSDPNKLLTKLDITNIAKFEKDIVKLFHRFPLPLDKQMVFNDLKQRNDSDMRNIGVCMRLSGKFALPLIQKALGFVENEYLLLKSKVILDGRAVFLETSKNHKNKILELKSKSRKHADRVEFLENRARRNFDVETEVAVSFEVVEFSSSHKYLVFVVSPVLMGDELAKKIIERLSEVYQQLRTGKKPKKVNNLLVDYADLIKDNAYFLSAQFDKDKKFWASSLRKEPPIIHLYGDQESDYKVGGSHFTEIDAQNYSRLKTYCSSHNLEIKSVVCALYCHLLYSLSDQKDLALGFIEQGQMLADMPSNALICDFPFRIDFGKDSDLANVAERIQGCINQYREHASLKISSLVNSQMIPQNGLSSFLKFTFSYQTTALKSLDSDLFQQDALNRFYSELGCSENSLNLSLVEDKERLIIRLKQSDSIYSKQFLDELLVRLENLIVAITEGKKLSKYLVVTDKEKQLLLTGFNDNKLAFKRDKTLHDLFAERAEIDAEKIAVVFENEQITYKELYARSRLLSSYLLLIGAKQGDLIGLCGERNIDLLVKMLAILMAGCAYVPLDPDYPEERLNYILKDSKARIVLTQSKIAAKFEQLFNDNIEIVEIDTQWKLIAKEGNKNPSAIEHLNTPSEALAYIIYTSGSTGKPKGVAIEHLSAVALVEWAATVFSAEELQGVFASTSICFDLSVFEIFVTLTQGGTIILARNALELEVVEAKNKITLINTVPSAITELIRANAVPKSVKTINLAGEPLSSDLVDKIYRSTSVTKVYDLYGPSEDTTYSTFVLRELNGPQTIGRPIANTQAYILDAQKSLLPIGVPGELYLAGDGLAREYLYQKQLTREKFVDNPFNPGSRMYKTGDLARWRGDGTLEYLGRIDNQVKVRGFRIEIGEIEARLKQHLKVKEAVVVTQGELEQNKLVGFYVLEEEKSGKHDTELVNKELSSHLASTLPEYMIPSVFQCIKAIPLTQNGKINRRELEQTIVTTEMLKAYRAPRNQIEKKLVKSFAKALNIEEQLIGIDNSFIELGGHSLIAYRLISDLYNNHKISLSLKNLLEADSIHKVAEKIGQVENAKPIYIDKADKTKYLDGYPLSFSQEQMWTICKMQSDTSIYNIPKAILVSAPVEEGLLSQILNKLVNKHQALRTVFPVVKGYPRQVILKEMRVLVKEYDLSNQLDSKSQQIEATEICQKLANIEFDLERGPLFNVGLIKLDEKQTILMFTIHHIVSDDWSVNIILKDVYDGIFNKKHIEAQSVTDDLIEYTDFAVWQKETYAKSDALAKSFEYWGKKLSASKQSIGLMTDFPRKNVQNYDGSDVGFRISPELTNELKDLATRNNVSLFVALLTIFKVLLYRYTDNQDICVGSVVANRQQDFAKDVVGLFVNTLALRTQIDPEDTFETLLQKVKKTSLEAIDNQDAPFDKVVENAKIDRNSSMNPIFQVMLILQNVEMDAIKESFTEYPIRREKSKFDFTVELFESNAGIDGIIEFNTQLYKKSTIEKLALHFEAIGRQLVKRFEKKIDSVKYLNSNEVLELTSKFNDTATPYKKDKCIHDLFADSVSRYKDKVAVVFQGKGIQKKSLTYGELGNKSDLLARYLQSVGISKDTIVGLYVDRSIDMLIAMLAIQKAGGAYLPLDPDFPEDRLCYMLEDSKAPLILTQSHLSERVKEFSPKNVASFCLDTEWQIMQDSLNEKNLAKSELKSNAISNSLAYVIYTSGSTGKPKGVMIEHRAFVNFILSMAKQPGISSSDKLLAVTTISFDIAGLELYLPLITGAQVCICPKESLQQSDSLVEVIKDYCPTIIQATPATWLMLFHSGWRNEQNVKALCGGEALSNSLRDEFCGTNTDAWNMFGPTETTVWSTVAPIKKDNPISIGKPIANTRVHILDRNQNLVPVGVPGELHISGDGLARGYLNRETLTQDKFIEGPLESNSRLYKTGDLARWVDDGTIEYLGRIDTQVKIRGYRIEVGEIENQLLSHPQITECAVVVRGVDVNKKLVAFYVPNMKQKKSLKSGELKEHLEKALPKYMLPANFVEIHSIPLTPNGKTDRLELQSMSISHDKPNNNPTPEKDSSASLEEQLKALWADVLDINLGSIGIHDNFFDLGGNSLNVVVLASRIEKELNCKFPAVTLFKTNSIHSIAEFIRTHSETFDSKKIRAEVDIIDREIQDKLDLSMNQLPDYYKESLAIIGVSCHLPGANDHWKFWKNLCEGKESVVRLGDQEFSEFNIDKSIRDNKRYVPTVAWLEGKELFDPGFFNISSGNAALMDPQFRQLLLHSWKAVEDAGYVCDDISNTSVFMSASNNFYQSMAQSINLNNHVMENSEEFVAWLLGQGGTIPTMISYQLGFKGQSTFVHTNCSSSLTALYGAFQSLQSRDVDYALVGAASFAATKHLGYIHQPGLNLSSDGHCKTFDDNADGLVEGEGVGVVLVKRAIDAIEAKDNIYCVIRGISVNNDGNDKAGFYAPSVTGQTSVIQQVLEKTKINPETINYVEAHGTGTALGDPIEVMALSEAYQEYTSKTQFCGIGSVKPNIGHLDTAAGLVGLIKLSLCLNQNAFPPLINYSQPNQQIDFASSPFYALTEKQSWVSSSNPKRAALSSFGIGGTNTHAILEEFPRRLASEKCIERDHYLYIIPLSAKGNDVLIDYVTELLHYLSGDKEQAFSLADIAFTLQTGRKEMQHRVVFVVETLDALLFELRAFIENQSSSNYIYRVIEQDKQEQEPLAADEDFQELIQHWIKKNKALKLAKLWAEGEKLNWHALYSSATPQRISLPTYPFAKEPFWIQQNQSASMYRTRESNSIHPLLHSNMSDMSQQSYSSKFSGKESFLVDHVINQQKILPAVAYLEIAREAVKQAIPENSRTNYLEITDVVWLRPIIFEEQLEVQTLLDIDAQDNLVFEIYSLKENSDETEKVLHCQGRANYIEVDSVHRIDSSELIARMASNKISAKDLYQRFYELGTDFGPAHRSIDSISQSQNELLITINLPDCVAESQELYFLHPSVMDAVLQASTLPIAGFESLPEKTTLPFALDSMQIYSECNGKVNAWIRFAEGSQAGDSLTKLDIDIFDDNGHLCVSMSGYSARVYNGAVQDKASVSNSSTDLVMAYPSWQQVTDGQLDFNEQLNFTERHVLTLGLESVNLSLLSSDCQIQNISLTTLLADTKELGYTSVASQCFAQLQNLIKAKPRQKILIQVLIEESPQNRTLLGLSGLFTTAKLENPNVIGQVFIVNKSAPITKMTQTLERLGSHPKATFSIDSIGEIKVQSWLEYQSTKESELSLFKSNGVYVITGGLGSLGEILSLEIIDKSQVASIILTGRSEIDDEIRAKLSALSIDKIKLEYQQLDLENSDKVNAFFVDLLSRHHQINGIFHCAGMIADNFIFKKQNDEFNRVLAPKVSGTYNLDLATKDLALDFIVLFSSESSLGSVGQSDYACANGFMDHFAEFRNKAVQKGLRYGRTISINWPLWKDGGMTVDEVNLEIMRKNTGMIPMSTDNGIFALKQSLLSSFSQMLVVEGETDKIHARLFTDEAAMSEENEKNNQGQIDRDIGQEKKLISSNENTLSVHTDSKSDDSNWLQNETEVYLAKQFSELFKVPAHKIDPNAALESYGIDSIMAINLINQLEETFGSLSKTLLFEYQTVAELADFFVNDHANVLNQLFAQSKQANQPVHESKAAQMKTVSEPAKSVSNYARKKFPNKIPSNHSKDSFVDGERTVKGDSVAIVGLSGRYPESVDIEEYWNNLRSGKDCIREIPKERWDWQDYYTNDKSKDGHHYSKWGGFISGVDEFDPRFFNISPKEAEILDPQERLFLQHAWKAVEDSGYTRKTLQVKRENNLPGQVGVYVGVMYSEYQLLGAEASQMGHRIGFANSLADIANRVSYVFNFHGPSLTVDTMCSSSLTAVHLACQDLKTGQTDVAVAGGVNVNIHPNKYLILSAGQYISTSGHCHSFGVDGDGYTPGEGVGAVVLKRLADAERDSDNIYGVIRGSTLNHGGKTNGYTVPNPNAQSDAISQVLREARIDPRAISYIEAHGTGTKLGDPIEITALTKAFYKHAEQKATGYCRIGSAKSNIGHCESAAGIAGLTKVLLQMKHKKIVPSLHSQTLNPHIDFEKTPFIVNQKLQDWQRPEIDGKLLPRVAGISSFGAGGANAHMIIEEYRHTEAVSSLSSSGEGEPSVILLSARTDEQLQRKVEELLHFVKQQANQINVNSLAYTLQVGRESMQHRLGLVVDSIDTLIQALDSYLKKEKSSERLHQGDTKLHKDYVLLISQDEDMQVAINKWLQNNKLEKLVELWVKGLEVDWNKLYGETLPRKISLPVYPFSEKRFWWNSSLKDKLKSGNFIRKISENDSSRIHSLLEVNRSVLGFQCYSSNYNIKDKFLFIGSQSDFFISLSIQLEMARAAVENAAAVSLSEQVIEFKNIVWGRPIEIGNAREVSIALFETNNDCIDFEIYSIEGACDDVLCQGVASIDIRPDTHKVDTELLKTKMSDASHIIREPSVREIYQSKDECLIGFDIKSTIKDYPEDLMLQPAILDVVFQSVSALFKWPGESVEPIHVIPSAIDRIVMISSFKSEMWALIKRRTENSTEIEVDIHLYTRTKQLAAKLSGVRYQKSNYKSDEVNKGFIGGLDLPIRSEKNQSVFVPSAQNAPLPISFISGEEEVVVREKLNVGRLQHKPDRIILASLSEVHGDIQQKQLLTKPRINFNHSMPSKESQAREKSLVEVFDKGEGIFEVCLVALDNKVSLSEKRVEQLGLALQYLRQVDLLKVVVFKSVGDNFLTGGKEAFNYAVESNLYTQIVEFPYPTIACVSGDVVGAGLMFGVLCDFMVLSKDIELSLSDDKEMEAFNDSEYNLYSERLGRVPTNYLFANCGVSEWKLENMGLHCPILESNQVDSYCDKLAKDFSNKSSNALKHLKQHLSRNIKSLTESLVSYSHNQLEENLGALENDHAMLNFSILQVSLSGIQVHVHITELPDSSDDSLLIAELIRLFDFINQASSIKVLIVDSSNEGFLPLSSLSSSYREYKVLRDKIISSNAYTIAVLNERVHNLGFLVTQVFDWVVYNERGQYRFDINELAEEFDLDCFAILGEKFGKNVADQILLKGLPEDTQDLRHLLPSATFISSNDEVKAIVNEVSAWSDSQCERMLKLREVAMQSLSKRLSYSPKMEAHKNTEVKYPRAPTVVDIKSDEIIATAYPEGILVIKMQDKRAKNMFSNEFVEGMKNAYQHIDEFDGYKAVVLVGFDSYFASGGTKEALVAIQQGKAKFTDIETYHAALSSKIPVVAAMQGHAIGAGWSMGMFADILLFSNESKYFSPYMSYGFTPGAGSTLILTQKLGYDLTRDSLLAATTLSGSELEQRKIPYQVFPREETLPKALIIAKKIARLSLARLSKLKQWISADTLDMLPDVYRLELEMHDKTFVGRSDTLETIEANFASEKKAEIVSTAPIEKKVLESDDMSVLEQSSTTKVQESNLSKSLRQFLADELHLEIDEIDGDEQFIDLGLDSITGVTWVRKINEVYNLSIEATKVYSYPTLNEFTDYITSNLVETENKSHSIVKDIHQISSNNDSSKTSNELLVRESEKNIQKEKINTDVTETVKQYLAQELHMDLAEIDDQAQFIDLGLDSITGVTWVRKINEAFNLSIEATKIYSYPTLKEFCEYISSELGEGEGVSLVKAPQGYDQNTGPDVNEEGSRGNKELTLLQDVEAELTKLLAQELHMDTNEIDVNAQFIDLGLDSITGVTWVRKINDKYQLSIEATKVYSYPTIGEFSELITSKVSKTDSSSAEPRNNGRQHSSKDAKPAISEVSASSANVTARRPSVDRSILNAKFKQLISFRKKQDSKPSKKRRGNFAAEAIAVIGMAGQFPKAKDLDEFWINIATGKNCISEISKQRWNIDDFYEDSSPKMGKTNSRWMGALEEYDLFDPLFFNISPVEAEYMDPQQRLFLQASWQCIENAGYSSKSLSGSKCGVFVGCSIGDYNLFSNEQQLSAQGFTGNSISILAARISYLLNLQGPCISIETACSSSLVAIANACDSLITGSSDLVLAGGVHVMSGPSLLIKTAQSGMLSTEGKCFTFDQRANGFVAGEGVGVIMLKRLSEAEQDNDIIQGIVQGWGVNQDGKTNGITAPNPDSQTRLQQDIYEKFDINPENIQLIEAHGTGTKLGDPIEVDGLKNTFKQYTDKTQFCALGSVKSNIGHCVTAAGVAGFIKAIYSLKNKQLPPTINFESLNEHIDIKNSPFFISDRLRDWTISEDKKRMAAISSFGFSGTNAHIVVSEYTPTRQSEIQPIVTNVIVALSAKTNEQLKKKIKDLKKYILLNKNKVELVDLAYTLQVGRDVMSERIAIVASSFEDLEERLNLALNKYPNLRHSEDIGIAMPNAHTRDFDKNLNNNSIDAKSTIIDELIESNSMFRIASLWCNNFPIPWEKLYLERTPSRINLPVYPFAKDRCWIQPNKGLVNLYSKNKSDASSRIHPLLHQNVSNLNSQSYLSSFNTTDFFIQDHKVMLNSSKHNQGQLQNVFPGVAYLEMVSAAISDAANVTELQQLELNNVVWIKPIVLDARVSTRINLYSLSGTQVEFEISSSADAHLDLDKEALDLHEEMNCQGQAEIVGAKEVENMDFESIRDRMKGGAIAASKVYQKFLANGLDYGPANQVIESISLGDNEIFAHLMLDDSFTHTVNEFVLHPSLLDGALQSTIGLKFKESSDEAAPSIPFALDKLKIIAPTQIEMYVWARYSESSSPSKKLEKFDIDIFDSEGRLCVQMLGFSTRVIESNSIKNRTGESPLAETRAPINDEMEFDVEFYEEIIDRVLDADLSIEDAAELG